ncbi:hypothetical protein I5G67_gp062 [Mycobacterium phage Aminay]|uniref:Uncharacterized protein n=1 Tax=Mycobacterium phage Aminay TaxID=2250291 RepID=A0A345KV47_9CAUD|nr:hypothetical protein I5G67_gp062 [Mycobacterium phage Aminay]AXH46899.1 hypothetical protein SEA_AMINAY_62 [Mycobacterium phage Aminay]
MPNYNTAFRAKYPGKCDTCGEIVDEGDMIRVTDERTIVHAQADECSGEIPDAGEAWRSVPVCTLCWTQHRGECA